MNAWMRNRKRAYSHWMHDCERGARNECVNAKKKKGIFAMNAWLRRDACNECMIAKFAQICPSFAQVLPKFAPFCPFMPIHAHPCPSMPIHAHSWPKTHINRGKWAFPLSCTSPYPSSILLSHTTSMATRNTGLVTSVGNDIEVTFFPPYSCVCKAKLSTKRNLQRHIHGSNDRNPCAEIERILRHELQTANVFESRHFCARVLLASTMV